MPVATAAPAAKDEPPLPQPASSPPPRVTRLMPVLGRIAGGGAIAAIGAAAQMAMHIVLGRQLGPAGYGVFAFGLGLGLLLGYIAPLGWQTAITRWLPEYAEKGEPGLARGALRRSQQITALVALAAAAATAAIGLAFWRQQPLLPGFVWGAVIIVFAAQRRLARRQLMGFERPRLALFLDDAAVPLGVTGAALWWPPAGAAGALGLYAAISALNGGLCLGAVRAARPAALAAARAQYRMTEWWRTARPLTLADISRLVVNRSDVLLLGPLAGAEAVGAFSAVSRLAFLGSFALSVLSVLYTPKLAKEYYRGDSQAFRANYAISWGLSVMPAAGVLVVASLFAEWLLVTIWGEDFAAAAPLLIILAAAAFVRSAIGPASETLALVGGERTVGRSIFAAAAIQLGVGIPAIIVAGGFGAALTTLLATTVAAVWQFIALLPSFTGQAKTAV